MAKIKNPFVKIPNLGTGVDEQEGWLGIPYWCWVALLVLVLLITAIAKAKRDHDHS